ncbi:MAG: hypothetical protein IKP60_13905 [Treponema sp.]|nr:hypothetical protein [Treponema sp.]
MTELIKKAEGWYSRNYDEWAEGEDSFALEEELIEAYVAGATENGIVWHKVADGDLPGNTDSVLSDKGVVVYYNFTHACWVDERASVEIDDVIAWCEIPQFKESE